MFKFYSKLNMTNVLFSVVKTKRYIFANSVICITKFQDGNNSNETVFLQYVE